MATASSLLSISSTSYLKVRCSVLWWSDLHSLAETVACSGCPLRSQLGIWILDIDIGAFWSTGRYQILCGSRPEPIPSRVRFLCYYDAIMDSSCLGAMHLKSRMVRVVLGDKSLEVFPNTALKAVPYPAQLHTAACSLPIVPFFIYKVSCTWICRPRGKLRRGQRWERGKQGFSCPVLSRACHWNKWEISHSTVHRQLSLFFKRKEMTLNILQSAWGILKSGLWQTKPYRVISSSPPNLRDSLHPGSLSNLFALLSLIPCFSFPSWRTAYPCVAPSLCLPGLLST